MKNYGIKIILTIIFFVVSLFLSNDLGVIKIEKTAIITAIAIDPYKDNIKVSAQITLPQAVDTKTNSDSIVTGYGKTIGLAIDDIAVKTGWYPKLSFCNLVIINKEIADKTLIEVINYSLYSQKLYDSILIAYSDKEASKVLSTTGSLDNISSFSIQKILLKNADNANAVYFSRVKDIALNLTNQSKQNLIPLIKLEKDEKSQKTETGQNEQTAVFNATTTMLLNNGKIVGEFSTEETLFYNLIVKGVKEIYFEVPLENNQTALLKVIDSNSNVKITPNKNLVDLYINLQLKVYLIDIKSPQIFETPNSNIVPQNIIQSAEEKVKKEIDNLINKSFTTNCDFFLIKESLFRHHPNFYLKNKQNFNFSLVSPKIQVKISSLDTDKIQLTK